MGFKIYFPEVLLPLDIVQAAYDKIVVVCRERILGSFYVLQSLTELHSGEHYQLSGKNRLGLSCFKIALPYGTVVPIALVEVTLTVIGYCNRAKSASYGVFTHKHYRMLSVVTVVGVYMQIHPVFKSHFPSPL